MSSLWIGLTIVAIIIEIISINFFSFFIAIGAFCAYISAILGLNTVTQVIIFSLITTILLVFIKPFTKNFIKVNDNKTNINSIITKQGLVTKEIDNLADTGMVKVNGELWSAHSEDNEKIEEGAKVEVVSVKGVKLVVKKID